MANSAQLTSSVSYPIPGPFLPGFANKLQVPVPANVALPDMLSNFIINGSGNLVYTGTSFSRIAMSGLVSIGNFIPSQLPPPPLPLDSGPKVRLNFFMQVGSQEGNTSSLVLTYYYPAFEWGATYEANTVDTFDFGPGDEVTFWTYYEWLVPPVAPVDPNTFYVTIGRCNLSLTAFSSSTVIPRNTKPMSVNTSSVVKTVPVGLNVNSVLYTFKPRVKGVALTEVRVNIPEMKAFINASGTYAPLIVGINNYIYLAVNGDILPQQVAYAFSGNQPFVSNGDTIFPSTLVTRLLTYLRETDEISVIYNTDEVFIVNPSSPAGFGLLTDGTLTAKFDFSTITTEALSPQAMVRQASNQNVVVPIGSSLNTAVEFPLTDCKVDSTNFELDEKNNLIYIGEQQSWFKFKASFSTNTLVLNNSDGEVAVVDLANVGFAIGIDGQKENNVVTESQTYTSLNGTFNLVAGNTVENAFRVRPGDRISFLVYANDTVYTIAPPIPGVIVKTPPINSTLTLSGRLVLSIE